MGSCHAINVPAQLQQQLTLHVRKLALTKVNLSFSGFGVPAKSLAQKA